MLVAWLTSCTITATSVFDCTAEPVTLNARRRCQSVTGGLQCVPSLEPS